MESNWNSSTCYSNSFNEYIEASFAGIYDRLLVGFQA
jgi:hypothetical protein